MKQILIKFPDDMSDMKALSYINKVVGQGKISNEGKSYCYVSWFSDGIFVYSSDRSKHPTFKIAREKK